jgi:hypothetical protein
VRRCGVLEQGLSVGSPKTHNSLSASPSFPHAGLWGHARRCPRLRTGHAAASAGPHDGRLQRTSLPVDRHFSSGAGSPLALAVSFFELLFKEEGWPSASAEDRSGREAFGRFDTLEQSSVLDVIAHDVQRGEHQWITILSPGPLETWPVKPKKLSAGHPTPSLRRKARLAG